MFLLEIWKGRGSVSLWFNGTNVFQVSSIFSLKHVHTLQIIVFYNIHCNFKRHNWCLFIKCNYINSSPPEEKSNKPKKQLYDRCGCQEDRTSRLPQKRGEAVVKESSTKLNSKNNEAQLIRPIHTILCYLMLNH